MVTVEKLKHRAYTIMLIENDDEIEVRAIRDDGSLIEHNDNPDFFSEKEDAINHGKIVIDEFLED